jgi:hypothetical protein
MKDFDDIKMHGKLWHRKIVLAYSSWAYLAVFADV